MSRNPAKILVVDDEPFNVDYLSQELEDWGYLTLSAYSGLQALNLMADNPPDLVLLDIMMPGMDGFEVLRRIKADANTRNIPVIILSALDDISSVSRGIEAGADDYLPKPFEPVLLRARLTSSLEKKRLYDQEQKYLHGLERELEIGRQIQAGFLPTTIFQPEGWEIAAHFQAARQVAGDFYDVFPLPNSDQFGLFLGDVSDKGVGAALYMTLFRSLLRVGASPDYFIRRTDDLASLGFEVLPPATSEMTRLGDEERLRGSVLLTNNYIADMHGDTGMFATLFFGLLNPATGKLHYINAGHEQPCWIKASGELATLPSTGPAIGVFAGVNFAIRAIQLEPGDTLLVYSDGVTDAQDGGHEFFSTHRLQDILVPPPASAAGLVASIVAALQAHMADSDQFDDITLLALRSGKS